LAVSLSWSDLEHSTQRQHKTQPLEDSPRLATPFTHGGPLTERDNREQAGTACHPTHVPRDSKKAPRKRGNELTHALGSRLLTSRTPLRDSTVWTPQFPLRCQRFQRWRASADLSRRETRDPGRSSAYARPSDGGTPNAI